VPQALQHCDFCATARSLCCCAGRVAAGTPEHRRSARRAARARRLRHRLLRRAERARHRGAAPGSHRPGQRSVEPVGRRHGEGAGRDGEARRGAGGGGRRLERGHGRIRNLDAYNRSAYYYKERDGKLTAGPLWDYNYSLDSGRASTRAPAGWQYEQPFTDPDHLRVGASDWYLVLARDPEFGALVAARWRELRAGLLSEQALNERISALAEPLARAAERDSQRWPVRRVISGDLGPLTPTWSGQVQAIRDWLALRVAWLDGEFQ
jgi:CotH kinase protein